jgi:CheY-like chemotaxis protein
MSYAYRSEQLAAIRDEIGVLVQRARDHEEDLETLVAAAETNLLRAEEISDAFRLTQAPVERLQALLSTQLQRSHDGAETARQLRSGAREQRLAAGLVLTHLDRDFNPTWNKPHSRGEGVLVVDDYGDIRETIAEVLRNAGFVVRTAANGLEGLLAAYEMRPTVIVMDVTMPVLDGIEATRLIKATDATSQARVIAFTGSPPRDDILIQNLFAAVVRKPATPAVLLATVQHVASL